MTAPRPDPPLGAGRPPSAAQQQQAIERAAQRLRASVEAALIAANSAGAAGKPLTGTAQAILKAVGLAAIADGVLLSIALSELTRMADQYAGQGQTSRSRRQALWDARDQAAATASRQAADRLALALRDVSRHAASSARSRTRSSERVRSAPPGVHPHPSSQPSPTSTPQYTPPSATDLSRAIALTAQETAKHNAAEYAGWPTKTWHSQNDNRVRISHQVLASPNYEFHKVPIGTPFVSAVSGAKLMYPGDPQAPLEEVLNCRCWATYSAPPP